MRAEAQPQAAEAEPEARVRSALRSLAEASRLRAEPQVERRAEP